MFSWFFLSCVTVENILQKIFMEKWPWCYGIGNSSFFLSKMSRLGKNYSKSVDRACNSKNDVNFVSSAFLLVSMTSSGWELISNSIDWVVYTVLTNSICKIRRLKLSHPPNFLSNLQKLILKTRKVTLGVVLSSLTIMFLLIATWSANKNTIYVTLRFFAWLHVVKTHKSVTYVQNKLNATKAKLILRFRHFWKIDGKDLPLSLQLSLT